MIRELCKSIACVMWGRNKFIGYMYSIWLDLGGFVKGRKTWDSIMCMFLEIVFFFLPFYTKKGELA